MGTGSRCPCSDLNFSGQRTFNAAWAHVFDALDDLEHAIGDRVGSMDDWDIEAATESDEAQARTDAPETVQAALGLALLRAAGLAGDAQIMTWFINDFTERQGGGGTPNVLGLLGAILAEHAAKYVKNLYDECEALRNELAM